MKQAAKLRYEAAAVASSFYRGDRYGDPGWPAGCGPLLSLAQICSGETVLELGSGDGSDTLLAARQAGALGRAFGLDLTDDILACASGNQQIAGLANVEFLKGQMHEIPLPNESVDVIISKRLVSGSADKDRVLREAFRVLRPGGRLALTDLVMRGNLAHEVRRPIELGLDCQAGALEEAEYFYKLAKAGFVSIEMEPIRVYRCEDTREFLAEQGIDAESIRHQIDGKFMSAATRAQRPYRESRQ